jgi:PAS domain S-box-containing protein
MHDIEGNQAVTGGESSEQRRIEEALRESRRAFRELIELAPDAVVVGSADYHVTDVNAAACKLYGYSREEFLGKAYADLTTPKEAERFASELSPIPGRVHVAEWVVKRKDGTLVPIEASIKILPGGRLLGFLRNITERKRAERERDEALWWMSAVLEQSPVGLAVVYGPRDDQAKFNTRAQKMLGLPRPPGPPRPPLRTLDGQLIEPDDGPIMRALRGERTVGAEFLVPNAAGRMTPIGLNAGPIAGPDGSVLGAVAAFEDITAAKELERLRAEWSSVVAHDLRQPLASISLTAEQLARATGDAKLLRYAERILAASKRLNRMVGDLMDLSRLDARRLELVRQPVVMPALVAASIEQVSVQAPDRTFDLRVQDEVPDADADPDRIAQVMENLLMNAVKYGKGGTPIVVTISHEDGEIAVAVTNEGRPLAAEELSHIFERFQRTASAKLEGIQGVGLGLYITRSLVEAHGGLVTASSTPAGVTFRFTLPAPRRAP